jgi:hypothetical protein
MLDETLVFHDPEQSLHRVVGEFLADGFIREHQSVDIPDAARALFPQQLKDGGFTRRRCTILFHEP